KDSFNPHRRRFRDPPKGKAQSSDRGAPSCTSSSIGTTEYGRSWGDFFCFFKDYRGEYGMTPSPLPSSPTSDTKALIRRLLRENLGSYVKSYIGAVFCMILVAGTTAASAWIVKDIVNQSFIEKR